MNKLNLVVISNELKETSNGMKARMQLGLENHVSIRHEGKFVASDKELYFEDGDEDLIGVGEAGSLSKTMMSYFGHFAPPAFARVPKGTNVEVAVTSITATSYKNKDGVDKASMTINGEMTVPSAVLFDMLSSSSSKSKSSDSSVVKKRKKSKKPATDKSADDVLPTDGDVAF